MDIVGDARELIVKSDPTILADWEKEKKIHPDLLAGRLLEVRGGDAKKIFFRIIERTLDGKTLPGWVGAEEPQLEDWLKEFRPERKVTSPEARGKEREDEKQLVQCKARAFPDITKALRGWRDDLESFRSKCYDKGQTPLRAMDGTLHQLDNVEKGKRISEGKRKAEQERTVASKRRNGALMAAGKEWGKAEHELEIKEKDNLIAQHENALDHQKLELERQKENYENLIKTLERDAAGERERAERAWAEVDTARAAQMDAEKKAIDAAAALRTASFFVKELRGLSPSCSGPSASPEGSSSRQYALPSI